MRPGEAPKLNREQLNSLIRVCPLIMDWLRNCTLFAADLFQQSYQEDYDNVARALAELVAELSSCVDSSFAKLSSLFQKYRASVWANALRLIITQSNPMIIPVSVGSDIVGTIPRLNGATTVNEVCHIIGPLLDKLPRTHFVTLGEFAALLRDTGSNKTFLACLIGPQLLLPNLLITSPRKQGPAALAAAAVFELIITEAENLFGRASAARVVNPFGEFVTQKTVKKNASLNFVEAAKDPTLAVAQRSLRAFYDWRDPVKSGGTERLFKRLSIFSIAEGIQRKYGVIPPGWGIILKELSENQSQLESLPPVSPRSPRRGLQTSSLLPTEVNFSAELGKARGKVNKGHEESKKLQLIIQEMCDSENRYYNVLNTFINTYCERLRGIFEGREQESSVAQLGISSQDMENLFGEKLVKCKDVAEEFVANLAVLTDFKGQDNQDGRGKLGLLLDATMDIFPKLEVLGPYMATYMYSVNLIKERTEALRKKKKKKKKKNAAPNFLQLWELERVQHDNVKLSSLENVLIKPVQRIPQYKTLLKELLSKAEKENHPATSEVKEMVERIEQLGQSIDRQVHLNAKAMKKFM